MKIRPLVLYHASCADGFGAAFAAWTKLGDNALYKPCKYGDRIHPEDWIELVQDREVYILDFSFPKPVMELAFKYAAKVVWLDHHKSAFEMWCGKDYLTPKRQCYAYGHPGKQWIELDNLRSGALIAWNYFNPGREEDTPMLIKHIDDGDRWKFKFNDTKAFTKALWGYAPWSFYQWNTFLEMSKREGYSQFPGLGMQYNEFIAEGEAILRSHNQQVQALVESVSMECGILSPYDKLESAYIDTSPWPWNSITGFSSLEGLSANCPANLTDDVGNELANKSGTYGLCWYMGKSGKIKVSLRSNDTYDVSVIAQAFGGGGHENAAGFETDIDTLMDWIN